MPRPDEPPLAASAVPEALSKTRRKATMHALQDLGEALVALDASRLAGLGLPERLVDAVTDARRIRAHEGRRRQMQYIGKLMRDIDPVPIREALERFASGGINDQTAFGDVLTPLNAARDHIGNLILHVRAQLEEQAQTEGRTPQAVWAEATEKPADVGAGKSRTES